MHTTPLGVPRNTEPSKWPLTLSSLPLPTAWPRKYGIWSTPYNSVNSVGSTRVGYDRHGPAQLVFRPSFSTPLWSIFGKLRDGHEAWPPNGRESTP